MADAVISVVVERAAAILEEQIVHQVNLVRGVEEEIPRLSEKLETIKDVLDDAEKRGAKEQSVKKWLKKLENIAYEMDDILDEWNYTLLRYKIEGDQSTDPAVASAKQKVCFSFIPSSSCLCFKKVVVRRDTAMKIQTVKDRLDQILKEKDEFSFVMSVPPTDLVPKPLRVQSTSSVELEKVCGHDINRNNSEIVRKLFPGSHSQILSVVGMGGIGKTIVASVGTQIIPPNTNQLELVLQKLRYSISGKKFLLVLDDVWTEKLEEWEPLKNILKYGAEDSKIIVTTRKEGVAKMMGTLDNDIYRPQHLTDEECWSLLSGIALLETSEKGYREFEDVGKKIASKCKGLPLAAKVLGSLLQCKRSLEEWEIWRLEKAEVDLFPHLLLSYNELSHVLKRCFSYCAVYPKDYGIHVESLIEEWMALGYLGSVTGNGGAEAKGREYFNNLAMHLCFKTSREKVMSRARR